MSHCARGVLARVVVSAAGGRVLGGGPGAVVAAGAAVGAAFTGSHLRVRVCGRGRQPAAAAEGALSYSLVLTVTSSFP
jgi:hypothetical protein